MDPRLDQLLRRLTAANAALAAGRETELFGAERRLCVYGTLAPGEPNHREVAHLGGTWTDAFVAGHRAQRRYPVFTFDPQARPVPMLLLESTALPQAWPQLDLFEGPGYRRILVPAMRPGSGPVAAFLYEAVTPVPGSA